MFGASKSGSAALPSDPDFEYVTLLLDGNGTNGGQNNTFLDSSTNNFTITRNGNTTQGSFSPYGDLWSNYFNGSSSIGFTNSSSFNLGSSNWTIEAWIFPTATSSYPVIAGVYSDTITNASFFWSLGNGNTNLELYLYVGSGSTPFVATNAVTLNAWNHVAAVRNGNTVIQYVNGVQVSSTSFTQTINNSTQEFTVGNVPSSTNYFYNGYVSNVRYVVGTAVYTSAFTPSTTPLTAVTNTKLLTCQSNRFIDNSSNNLAFSSSSGSPSVQRFSPFEPSAPYDTSVIGGSGYFDGSGDYLETASSSNQWAFGTGNFTVECWLYTDSATNRVIMANRSGTTGLATHWSLEFFNTAKRVEWHTGLAIIASSNTDVQLNAWVHIAVVRNSGTLKIYQNGVEVASASDSSDYSSVNPLLIANEPVFPSGNNPFLGYIANIRIVKGTAVYTTGFTPPTAPVTAITNTSFLANFTNASIFDYAMMNNLETAGNAQISTSVKKFGTGSISFDGTGDYLRTPANNFALPLAGNFTIEFWLYLNSTSTTQTIMGQWESPTFWEFYYLANTELRFYYSSSSYINLGALSTSTWYHVAAVRSGSTITAYLNGTSQGTATSSSTIGSATKALGLGSEAPWTGFYFNGYLDDVRITNGVARYTSNFTAPTAPFPIY